MLEQQKPKKSSFVRRLRGKILQSGPMRRLRHVLGRSESLRDLPYILEQANPKAKLADKMMWLENLMEWIRSDTEFQHDFDAATGQLHTVRVRFLLQLLERNPHWKI